MKRICTKCAEEKEPSEFYQRSNKRGVDTQCKECIKKQTRKWKSENFDKKKEANIRWHLSKRYGITIEQYNELLKKQKDCCAICDKHKDEFKVRLAVDHNHITGEIRGLLCTFCNHRLIGRHRDGNLLRKMAEYVDGGTGWFVPKKKKIVKRKKNV